MKNFLKLKTPQELMSFLNKNIRYGVLDKAGTRFSDASTKEFRKACSEDWKMLSPKQILKRGVAHCYDQVEIERKWFKKHGYKPISCFISLYIGREKVPSFTHTYLIFKNKGFYCLFEHADLMHRGIFHYTSIEELIETQAKFQTEFVISILEKKENIKLKIDSIKINKNDIVYDVISENDMLSKSNNDNLIPLNNSIINNTPSCKKYKFKIAVKVYKKPYKNANLNSFLENAEKGKTIEFIQFN